MSLDLYLQERLETLNRAGLLRTEHSNERGLDACSNDYLGLARASVSRETDAIGAGASRLIHGTHPAHRELEAALAGWVGLPSALIFSSGYAANVGLLSAVFGRGGTIVSDQANHASIIDGCRLARAQVRVVPHLDTNAVESALTEIAGATPVAVVVESYFSMDGDGPDLVALRRLCDRYGAFLFVDEAHALGVYGRQGAGRCADAGIIPDALIGGLGKAAGGQGGFVAGSLTLRDFLWNAARSFMFSTATSPLVSAKLVEQIRTLAMADADRKQLLANSEAVRRRLRAANLELAKGSFGPIVPVIVGSSERALRVSTRLAELGVRAQAIRPPTVPEGAARIRLTVKSWFSQTDIELLTAGVVGACRG